MKRHWFLCAWVPLLTITSISVLADEQPPKDSMLLSKIIKSLEDEKVGVITSAEFDDGFWEVQTRKNDRWFELFVDPKTGDIKRREPDEAEDEIPPADSLPLSSINKSVEKENRGTITDVEFDDGYWEIKIRNGNKRIKIDIDPKTGKKKGQ